MVDDSIPPPGGDVPLLAEILRNEGYATAGFYSGPYLHECFGFGRGFERYEPCLGFSTVFDTAGATSGKMSREKIGSEAARTEKRAHEAITSEEVTRRAVDFVSDYAAKEDERPFFLFLHYFDVHNDYLPPPPLDSRFGPPYDGWVDGRGVMTDPRFHAGMEKRDLEHLTALYDGEIASVDRSLNLFFRTLDKLDPSLVDNSIVVITSDHGEEFFDNGRLGHRHNLYESAVRIPLIFRCPGHIPPGGRISGTVGLCDILPTLLDLTGIETPPIVTGASLLPAMQKGVVSPRPVLLELTETPRGGKLGGVPGTGNMFRKHLALRLGDVKLITIQERLWSRDNPTDFTGDLIRQSHELYDLKTDPGERKNLYPAREDLFQKSSTRPSGKNTKPTVWESGKTDSGRSRKRS